jgi:hypothetical protein
VPGWSEALAAAAGVFPDRYAHAEEQTQQLHAELGDVAILRERRGGVSRPLTLTEPRRRQRAYSTTTFNS